MNKKINFLNFKNIIESFKLLSKLWGLLWSVKRSYLLSIIILQSISGLLPSIVILASQYLLNSLQSSTGKDFTFVLFPVMIYIGVNFFGFAISGINTYMQNVYKLYLNYRIEVMILNKVQKLTLSDFENSSIYDQIRRAQNNTSTRPFQVFSTILGILSQALGLISVLMILLLWRPWIIILALLIPIISAVYMAKIGQEQYQIEFDRVPERRKAWYLNYLMTNDIAYKEIKLYKLNQYFLEQYKKISTGFIKQDHKIIEKRTIVSMTLEFIDQIIGGLIIVMIVLATYGGEILIGNTVAYIRSLSSVKSNTQELLNSFATMYQNNLYIKELFDFLELQTQEVSLNHQLEEKVNIKVIKEIVFKNVSFKYTNKGEYVLKNISFKIKEGENISIVGENGSGKSTLIKLLAGFYDNYEGEILINGISTRKINHDSFKDKIGVIFQDFNRYELSCRENIGFGNLNYLYDDDELKIAIEKSYATEIISKLPQKMDTQLGVWFGGLQLSGGQWQRIALARAFMRNADCYILDEPSSALDPVSENELLKNTAELTKDKISIFISHRLSNLKKVSSRILVLKKGVLVEDGTHDYLMSQNRHYRYLYNLQNEEELPMNLQSRITK